MEQPFDPQNTARDAVARWGGETDTVEPVQFSQNFVFRFRERDGIAGYEPLLIGIDGEARDPTNRLSRDLAEGYLHGVGPPWLTGAERMAFQVRSPEGEASSLAPPAGSNPSC